MFVNGRMTKSAAFTAPTVKSYVLVVLVLAATMLSRPLVELGVPAPFNFVHFGLTVAVVVLLCYRMRAALIFLVAGIWVLAVIIIASALINDAGIINVVLDFLLVTEPFLLLLAIVSTPWSLTSIRSFRYWILFFAILDVIMCYFQRFILGYPAGDPIRGLFISSDSGAHTAGALAFIAAIYFIVDFPLKSTLLRILMAVFMAATIILTDSKQVVLVALASLLVLVLIKVKDVILRFRDVSATLSYVVVGISGAVVSVVVATYVYPWLLPNTMDNFREGIADKFSVFSIFASYYTSPLNWLLGLGPGHTSGRLGLMLPDYMHYLQPLGATIS